MSQFRYRECAISVKIGLIMFFLFFVFLEENSDLSGLNDDIEQLLKDTSKPPIPANVIARQLSSTIAKPVKRNAKGQQVPSLISRYLTPDDVNILRKPMPNVQNLPSTVSTTRDKRKFKPPVARLGWAQFSDEDDDDDYQAAITNTKLAFIEEHRGSRDRSDIWTHRRQDTPFPTAGISSDEDEEEEIERCTSPVKRQCDFFVIRSAVNTCFLMLPASESSSLAKILQYPNGNLLTIEMFSINWFHANFYHTQVIWEMLIW